MIPNKYKNNEKKVVSSSAFRFDYTDFTSDNAKVVIGTLPNSVLVRSITVINTSVADTGVRADVILGTAKLVSSVALDSANTIQNNINKYEPYGGKWYVKPNTVNRTKGEFIVVVEYIEISRGTQTFTELPENVS